MSNITANKEGIMNRKITLALLFTVVMGFTALTEAQSMNIQALNHRQQTLVPVAAFTANGDIEKLKTALNQGLDAGLTVNEIKEILVQMYAYAGFPRSLNAIGAFMAVMDDRQNKGIKDEPGKEASPLSADKNSLELGTANQTRLAGMPVTGQLYEFAPAIDQFLKGHLFGDIFGRDNLDWQSREIATIAALASMDGVNSQLQAHFNLGLNTGLSPDQLKEIVTIIKTKVGIKAGDNAQEVLGTVLSTRSK
jgi:alkylhydroperoxidase/carboxymuconolactone decarboxylase family protein YurZ